MSREQRENEKPEREREKSHDWKEKGEEKSGGDSRARSLGRRGDGRDRQSCISTLVGCVDQSDVASVGARVVLLAGAS